MPYIAGPREQPDGGLRWLVTRIGATLLIGGILMAWLLFPEGF